MVDINNEMMGNVFLVDVEFVDGGEVVDNLVSESIEEQSDRDV